MSQDWPQKEAAPIVAIVGRSGSGKTTLLEKLVPELNDRGHLVGTVKHHAHPGFDFDKPGKDSYRHKQSGAHASVISAPDKLAMVHDTDGEEWELPKVVARLMPDVDLVIAEGFSSTGVARVILTTEDDDKDLFGSGKILATLTPDENTEIETHPDSPTLTRDDVKSIADIIENYAELE